MALSVSVFYLELSSFLCYSLSNTRLDVFSLFSSHSFSPAFSCCNLVKEMFFFCFTFVLFQNGYVLRATKRKNEVFGDDDGEVCAHTEDGIAMEKTKKKKTLFISLLCLHFSNIIRHNKMSVKWQRRLPTTFSLTTNLSVGLKWGEFHSCSDEERKTEFWFLRAVKL